MPEHAADTSGERDERLGTTSGNHRLLSHALHLQLRTPDCRRPGCFRTGIRYSLPAQASFSVGNPELDGFPPIHFPRVASPSAPPSIKTPRSPLPVLTRCACCVLLSHLSSYLIHSLSLPTPSDCPHQSFAHYRHVVISVLVARVRRGLRGLPRSPVPRTRRACLDREPFHSCCHYSSQYQGSMQLSRAARIILVGAPGVGKGTQTARLMDRFPQLSAISSGDLLRQNVRSRTPLGMSLLPHSASVDSETNACGIGIQAESRMKAGSLLPDSMILRLILNELTTRGWLQSESAMPYTLNSTAAAAVDAFPDDDPFLMTSTPQSQKYRYSDDPHASFILDGFPRTAAQAAQIDNLFPINLVVNLNTPTSIIMDRICNRWVHEPSGRVYNTTFNAPKVDGRDDVTGEPLTRRSDDDAETWKVRLKSFKETSLPLLEHYDKLGVLWTVEGNSSDEITPRLFEEFGRRFGLR